MNQRIVYMDHNATTPLLPDVKTAIVNAMEFYANPSSFHELGRIARFHIENARDIIAEFIGAQPEEIIFTSGASESNNTVLNSVICTDCQCLCQVDACKQRTPHVITSAIEHPSVYATCQTLAKRGIEVTFVPVNAKGQISVTAIEKEIRPTTVLVSIMLANNEIGTIQPIEEITKLVKSKRVLMHTDAVQALTKIPLNVNALGVDFMSLSGHKVYGPKGIGVLYVRRGVSFCPLIIGGHHEFNRRAGTENTLAMIGFGRAIEVAAIDYLTESKRLKKLRDHLKSGIEKTIPEIIINGDPKNGLPNTLNVSFKYIEGEALLLDLDFAGIAVSTGSACASGSLDPSHVLLATGIDAEYAHSSIRFSLGRANTEEDIDYVIRVLGQSVLKLRKMSPLYKGI